MITLWHSEQVKVSRNWNVTVATRLFIAGWWSGSCKSKNGMDIIAGTLQQLHDRKPCFRRSLSVAQGCAFGMRCGIVDSAGCPVVVESEALSALQLRHRAAVRAVIVTGLTQLLSHLPGHCATTLVD